MSQPLLKISDVTKVYAKGEKAVLRGIHFEVQAGETVSIIGASGTGKSTLLHILGALDAPTQGKVFFEGQDLFVLADEAQARFRNEKLGFVFQFHHLLPDFTALENIMMPLLLRGMPLRNREEKAQVVLKEVGLSDKANSLPAQLSGGEQQRIAVARAIVTDPVLLLADEPTGNLDAATGERLMELLFDLNRQRGLTLVYVSHNETLAAQAQRCFRLVAGEIHEGES